MSIQAVKAQSAGNKINSLLVAMGAQVDEAVDQSIVALLDSHTHSVSGLMENAVAIQELERAIDQAALTAVEREELLPSEITLIVNISKDLARLGKLAANLGRRVTKVGHHHEHEDFSRLQPLAIAVSHQCRLAL